MNKQIFKFNDKTMKYEDHIEEMICDFRRMCNGLLREYNEKLPEYAAAGAMMESAIAMLICMSPNTDLGLGAVEVALENGCKYFKSGLWKE